MSTPTNLKELGLKLNETGNSVGASLVVFANTWEKQQQDLLAVVNAMRTWIDAVPNDVVLPAMPGFDRDWMDSVIQSIESPRKGKSTEEIVRDFLIANRDDGHGVPFLNFPAEVQQELIKEGIELYQSNGFLRIRDKYVILGGKNNLNSEGHWEEV